MSQIKIHGISVPPIYCDTEEQAGAMWEMYVEATEKGEMKGDFHMCRDGKVLREYIDEAYSDDLFENISEIIENERTIFLDPIYGEVPAQIHFEDNVKNSFAKTRKIDLHPGIFLGKNVVRQTANVVFKGILQKKGKEPSPQLQKILKETLGDFDISDGKKPLSYQLIAMLKRGGLCVFVVASDTDDVEQKHLDEEWIEREMDSQMHQLNIHKNRELEKL